jgi:hypothetical protein
MDSPLVKKPLDFHFCIKELLDSQSDWSPEISPASTFSVPPGTLWTREMPPNHCAPRPTCEICWPRAGNQDGKGKKKTSLVCKSSNRQNIIIIIIVILIIIIIEEEKRNIVYLVTAFMIRNPGSHIWSRRLRHFLRSNRHDPYFIGKLGNVSLIIRSA